MTAKNKQHTICKEISYSGIGLHSGKDVLMTFKPAAVNTGVVYVRTDLPGRPEIKALAENVSSTVKATTISANGAEVFTVEHLMAALSMM
ncbi:MAG: UDP-3-O-acyl-N-acetylglucosamine deacetylase, partial [Peptococcaceae bacterium]|nr:UDP-3-O-acyl-N-acetylglucosamine deacetylase [Peptococcaceae bacterium]